MSARGSLPDRDAGNGAWIAASIAAVRLDRHDADALFELDFHFEHTAEVINRDERAIAQSAQVVFGNVEGHLIPVSAVATIIPVVIVVIVVVVTMAAAAVVIIIVIVAAAGITVAAAIVIAIPIVVVVTAATTVATAMIIAATATAAVVIGKRGHGKRMRRTGGNQRERDGRRYQPAYTHGGNQQGFSKRDVHDLSSFS